MSKRNSSWLKYAEYTSLGFTLAGAIAAGAYGNLIYMAVPLLFSSLLLFINSYRLEQLIQQSTNTAVEKVRDQLSDDIQSLRQQDLTSPASVEDYSIQQASANSSEITALETRSQSDLNHSEISAERMHENMNQSTSHSGVNQPSDVAHSSTDASENILAEVLKEIAVVQTDTQDRLSHLEAASFETVQKDISQLRSHFTNLQQNFDSLVELMLISSRTTQTALEQFIQQRTEQTQTNQVDTSQETQDDQEL